MAKRKEFSVLKWIVFPANSVILAGIIAWFNLTVFGWDDGLPYSIIVAMIGVFSIIINKYTESANRSLQIAAFVFEIFLTAALVINATYSISVQRKMSIARMGEQSQAQTIEQIGKLKGSRTQREALQKIDKQESSQSVFSDYENVLFWIMAGELALYAISAFTLFALAKLLDDSSRAIQPHVNYKGERTYRILPDGRREIIQSTYSPDEVGKIVDGDDFPLELDVSVRGNAKESRLAHTQKSDSGRLSPVSADSIDRIEALKMLREHLREIAFYHPGLWFKADLMNGGVMIRMYRKRQGREEMVASTNQSDKLLKAVNHPDFRTRLTDELTHRGFPIERDKVGK